MGVRERNIEIEINDNCDRNVDDGAIFCRCLELSFVHLIFHKLFSH